MLIGNTFNRHYTDYDKMIEAEEWKEVLTQAKEEGSFLPEKGVRVRDYIAKIMKTSAAVVGDWNRINNNGTDALKEQFEAGTIGVTAAAAAKGPMRRSVLRRALRRSRTDTSPSVRMLPELPTRVFW